MALSRLSSPVDNVTTLTAALWTAEFDNIYNNALSLISPLTGNLDLDGNKLLAIAAGSVSAPCLYPTGDTNTGLYFSAADTVNITTGGSLAAQFGATPIFAIAPEDNRTTSTALFTFRATTSGTPAAGIGTGLKFQGESADENPSDFGRLEFTTSDVGAGTEDTAMDIWLRVAGAALAHKWQVVSTATAGLAVLTHANTATRVYTLPDATMTFVGADTTQTLTNKTITGTGFAQYVHKSADETVNNSATLQDDDALLYALAASKNYALEAHLLLQGSSTNADFKFKWTVPASCTMFWGPQSDYDGSNVTFYWAAGNAAVATALLTEGSTLVVQSLSGTHGISFYAIVKNSTNAGNITLQWAQNSATAENNKVLAGSFLKVTLLN